MPSQQQIDLALEGWKMMPLLFETLDVDSSGTLDRYELTAGMVRLIKENGLGITMSNVEQIMREVDLDNDNELDRREFGCFLSRVAQAARVNIDLVTSSLLRQKEKDAQLRVQSMERAWADMPALFSVWDFDKNGHIDRDEVVLGVCNFILGNKDVTGKLSIAECLQIMEECDSNGDRVLDKREFGAFVARFALATGVPMDRVVKSLMEECKKFNGRRLSATGKRLSASFAKMRVGMAEEEVLDSARPNFTQRTVSARGA